MFRKKNIPGVMFHVNYAKSPTKLMRHRPMYSAILLKLLA